MGNWHLRLRFMVRPRGRLFITCWYCKQRTDLEPAELIHQFGEDAGLDALRKIDFPCPCGCKVTSLTMDMGDDGVLPIGTTRLRDMVVERANFRVKCRRCENENAIRVSLLIARLGPDAGSKEIDALKFRCECGSDWWQRTIDWVEAPPALNLDWGGWSAN